MQKYNKALVAIVGAVTTSLAAFGIVIPEGIQGMVNTVVPLIVSVLVFFVPNKDA